MVTRITLNLITLCGFVTTLIFIIKNSLIDDKRGINKTKVRIVN